MLLAIQIAANEKRKAKAERSIEFMRVQEARHGLGDAYAAGIVALIRHTDVLPNKIHVSQLENSTAKVLVSEKIFNLG